MTELAWLLNNTRAADKNRRAVIGLDGFVDTIIRPVDRRTDKEHYTMIPTLQAFGERIASASGMSLNIEMIRSQQKMGGNGISMAYALSLLGQDTACLGAMGETEIHPVFLPLKETAELYSFAEPAQTSAVEFEDGKIISSVLEPLNSLTWEKILAGIGFEPLRKLIREAGFVALNNWTMIPEMDAIWEHILEEIMPGSENREKYFFFDLADPQKRTPEDVKRALHNVSRFTRFGRTIMSCNVREAQSFARILGVPDPEGFYKEDYGKMAADLCGRVKIDGFVIHTLKDAFLGTQDTVYEAEGDYTAHPVLTTGGGDNFNGGFAFGLLNSFDYKSALRLGSLVSGFYVRNGNSPSLEELIEYISE